MHRFFRKLNHKESTISEIFHLINDAVFIMEVKDNQFYYIFVNQAGLALVEYNGNILGKRIEEVVPSSTGSRLVRKYKEVVDSLKPITFVQEMVTSQGQLTGETVLNPILDEDSNCAFVLAIVRDITVRKQKESQLKEAKSLLENKEKRLMSLIEHNIDAVFEIDLNWKFVHATDKVSKIIGCTEEELVGTSIFDYVVERDTERINSLNNRTENGFNQEQEVWVRHKNGDHVLVEIKTVPIVVDGLLVGVYGIAKDITVEKSIEAELHEVKEQLELVWDNTSDAIFLIAQDGCIIKANPTFELMFGYSEQQIRAASVPFNIPDYEVTNYQRILNTIRTKGSLLNKEVNRVTKAGRVLNILASYKLINKGNILAVAMYKDITGRKRVQKKLEESEKRYRKLVELSPNPIVVHGQGRIKYINKAGIDVIGANNKNEIMGKSIWDFIHPDEKDDVSSFLLSLEKNLSDANFEVEKFTEKFVRLDGEVVYTEVTASPIEYDGELAIQAIFRDVTEQKRYEEKLEYLAYHDALTGLVNRREFTNKIENSIQLAKDKNELLAVMYLDMDKFKSINDTLGHNVGDELLKQFGARLEQNVRERDIVCRVGGDEFLILLDGICDKKNVAEIADRLYQSLQIPYVINEHTIDVTSSIGISLYPKDGTTYKLLIHHADLALYTAKEQRNGYKFY